MIPELPVSRRSSKSGELNLAQAVQSGRPFRRVGSTDWIELKNGNFYQSEDDECHVSRVVNIDETWFIVSDFELKEIQFTEEEFWYAYGSVVHSYKTKIQGMSYNSVGEGGAILSAFRKLIIEMSQILGISMPSESEPEVDDHA